MKNNFHTMFFQRSLFLQISICVFFSVYFYNCRQKNNTESRVQINEKSIQQEKKDSSTAFLDSLCLISFNIDCDTSKDEIYQVVFTNEPFKAIEIVHVLIIGDDIQLKHLSVTVKVVHSEVPKQKAKNSFYIKTNTKNRTLFCRYSTHKKIKIVNYKSELIHFFSKTLWSLYERDKGSYLDPEIWEIKAKNGKFIKKWQRTAFSDSTYYSNLQKLIDNCKIKDYKYMPKPEK